MKVLGATGRTMTLMNKMDYEQVARFWGKVCVSSPEKCWPWLGAHNSGGRGQFTLQGEHITSYRLAWILSKGTDPGPLLVCHVCDNPTCCNPSHLFVGTRGDNNRDSAAKNRTAYGEKSGQARLTANDVREIRNRHSAGERQAELVRRYGMSESSIHRIVHRQQWKRVV